MPKINSFEEALIYINRLGLGAQPGQPGWIIHSQALLCDIEEMLYKAAGESYPYHAKYQRKSRTFTVNGQAKVRVGRVA